MTDETSVTHCLYPCKNDFLSYQEQMKGRLLEILDFCIGQKLKFWLDAHQEHRDIDQQNKILSKKVIPSNALYDRLPLPATIYVPSTYNFVPETCPMLFFGVLIGSPLPFPLIWE